jgi:site-specific DNA recombinase
MTKQQLEDIQRVVRRRAIIYCRVSTDEQENNTSLETQEADCRKWAAAQGIEVVAVVYESFTGMLLWERKQLERVRILYKSGAANTVIVRTFDRLSRVQTHFAILTEEMQRYHVELECAKEHVDKSPVGQKARMIMSTVAEVEHTKIIERTTTGRRNIVVQKKKIIPSWKPRYGYSYDNPERAMKTRFLINEEEARVVQYIHERYDAGLSVGDIVRGLIRLGVKPPHKAWTRSAVRRILRYRPYTGKGQVFTEHDRNARYPIEPAELPEGLVPRIIDEELFERVQVRLEVNQEEASRNSGHSEAFLLRAGHVFCGECGRRMHGKRQLRGRDKQWVSLQYQCTAASELNTARAVCIGQKVNAPKLDALIWDYVQELAEDTNLIVRAIRAAIEASRMNDNVESVRQSIATWQARSEQFVEDLRNPNLRGAARDVILHELSSTEQMIEGLELEMQKIAAHEIDQAKVRQEYEQLLQWFERVEDRSVEEMPYTMKRNLLRIIGLKVYVFKTDKRHEDIQYDIKVTLPEIADLLSMTTDDIIPDETETWANDV